MYQHIFGVMTEKEIVEEVLSHINMVDIADYILSKEGFADIEVEKAKAVNCIGLALDSEDGYFEVGRYRCLCIRRDGKIVSLSLSFSETVSSYTYCE